MSTDEKMNQVVGILTRYDVKFQTSEDHAELRAWYGSTAVQIRVLEGRDEDQPVVHLTAPIAIGIDLDAAGRLKALEWVNGRNIDAVLLRFVLYADEDGKSGTLAAECDVLGSNLQGEELMEAAWEIAGVADGIDESTAADFGGQTLEAFLEEQESVET